MASFLLWARYLELGMWTMVSSQSDTLSYEMSIWWRLRGPQPRVLSLPLLTWNHHFRNWGTSDQVRPSVFSACHTHKWRLKESNSHLSTSLTLDLASAVGTWEQDERADIPLLLGRKPFTLVLQGEGALCSWLHLSGVDLVPH